MNEEKKLISVSKNFQSSVNIAYDLRDKKKVRDFIPTRESLAVIEELFESVFAPSSSRARILIGAYGKGKSHIVLEALNLLFEKDKKIFGRLLEKIKEENFGLYEDISNYLLSKRKILPVIISGSSTSLSQSFLLSLYQTLKQNELERFMPDTNFMAAVKTIQKWKEEYPLAYKALKAELGVPVKDFVSRLNDFDDKSYEQFEKIYPKITSGSVFNPFSNFDIVELYENVSKKLSESKEGFEGVFVVYDEFSKYLESSISNASINDIKLLQDFAEKCCRSSGAGNKNQLHLLLISHKEFSNYIDNLPKEKVDGWKGVSERFKRVVLNSDYSQVYEVIGEVIQKDKNLWPKFYKAHKTEFESRSETKSAQKLFFCKKEECQNVAKNCYPLSPFASYVLPRLSEKIAQNERTMFTFLAGNEKHSLASVLEKKGFEQDKVSFVECDVLFDYFEGSLRNESYSSPIKKTYSKAKKCLESLKGESGPGKKMQERIIKTVCLIYCLEQFERLSPTAETLADIYSYKKDDWKVVSEAIESLQKKNLLYLSRSNGFLILKENLSLDLSELLPNIIEKRKHKISEVQILNALNQEKYLYPVKYNIQRAMTRYFDFKFFFANKNDSFIKYEEEESLCVDGLAVALLFAGDESGESEKEQKEKIDYARRLSEKLKFGCLIVRKTNDFKNIARQLREIDAIEFLKTTNAQDKILLDELALMQEDLFASVQKFIQDFTHPENEKSLYFYLGKEKKLYRRSQLDSLLSEICESNFTKTPVVNNETLNKNILSGAADKSRRLLIDAILNSDAGDLGIEGGQELSFMRSALCVPGVLDFKKDHKFFDAASENLKENFKGLFCEIDAFIKKAQKESLELAGLVKLLSDKKNKIGLRRGLIPIYLSVSFSKIKRNALIKNEAGELALDSKTLCDLAENPEGFTLRVVSFDQPKAIYIKALCSMFEEHSFEKSVDPEKITYSQLVSLMLSWYRSLPKYSREKKIGMKKENVRFMGELKNALSNSQKFLFEILPDVFATDDFAFALVQKLEEAKSERERALNGLEETLASLTKRIFTEKIEEFKGAGKKRTFKESSSADESLCALYQKYAFLLQSGDAQIMNHKFENGAESVFAVFEHCGGDEHKIINTLSPVLTGINAVDWNDSTIETFERRLCEFLEALSDYAKRARGSSGGEAVLQKERERLERNEATAEPRMTRPEQNGESQAVREAPKIQDINEHRILFAGKNESVHFSRIECSKKAQGLQKELLNILDEYGQSVTKSEKREVLMSVLKELCK